MPWQGDILHRNALTSAMTEWLFYAHVPTYTNSTLAMHAAKLYLTIEYSQMVQRSYLQIAAITEGAKL